MAGQERHGPIGLQEHELEALVLLVRLTIGLDKQFTEEEADAISSIALEAGEEAFWSHMQASHGKPTDLQAILDIAKAVTRKEARAAIYISITDLASSDGIVSPEDGLIKRLQQLWNIPAEA